MFLKHSHIHAPYAYPSVIDLVPPDVRRVEVMIARAKSPFVCFVEGDGGAGSEGGTGEGGAGAGGAGGEGGEKSYKQSELEQIVKQRVAGSAKKLQQAEADLKALRDSAAATQARLDELEAQIADSSAKGDDAKARVKLEREFALLKKQFDDTTKERDDYRTKHDALVAEGRKRDMQAALRTGLTKANVHGPATDDVVDLMLARGMVEITDEGKVVVTIGDVPYEDVAKACAVYLDKNPHYRAGAKGGSGIQKPNGASSNGARGNEFGDDESATSLIGRGWKQRQTT